MDPKVVTEELLTALTHRMHALFQTKFREFESRMEKQSKELEEKNGQTKQLVDELLKLRHDVDVLKVQSMTSRAAESNISQEENKLLVAELVRLRDDVDQMKFEGVRSTSANMNSGEVEVLKSTVKQMNDKVSRLVGKNGRESVHTDIPEIESRLRRLRHAWSTRSQAIESGIESGLALKSFSFDQTPGGPGLGLQLDGSDGDTLIIKAIRERGIVGQWLSSTSPNPGISCGDQIVQVNDVRGSAPKMAEELAKQKTVRLTIRAMAEVNI